MAIKVKAVRNKNKKTVENERNDRRLGQSLIKQYS